MQDILHWLVYRQSTTLFEEEQILAIPVHSVNGPYEGSGAHHEAQGNQHHLNGLSAPVHHGGPLPGAFVVQGASLDGNPIQSSPETSRTEPIDLNWIGLNGRTNKVADTCYSFWVGGTLGVSHFLTLYMQVDSPWVDIQESASRLFQRHPPLPPRENTACGWRLWKVSR